MNIKNKTTTLILAIFCSLSSMAQIGIGTTTPNTNAALDVVSTTQGMLFPRMTTAQRNAISSPAQGLTIFNTDLNCLQTNISTTSTANWKNWVGIDPSTNGTANVSAYTCNTSSVGTIIVGTPASGVTQTITASVSAVGTYSISATANGVTFAGSGTFAGTGAQNIVLTATGTPISSGTASFTINTVGQTCTFTRTVSAGAIATINCAGATNSGSLKDGIAASSVNSVISYTGGNAGSHSGQTVTSTGVTGLTATLSAGNFASGAGTLTYTITGTPASAGTANFAINIGGQTCTLSRTVSASSVPNVCNTSNPTAIVDVVSTTGKTWMDRNLGATRVATSSTDVQSYGSSYQWGRRSDGHQCVNRYTGDGVTTSSTTSTNSTTNTPSHGNFIIEASSPYDWLTSQNNNLWQGVSGINNPCPSGYRLPTEAEWSAEITALSISNTSTGASSVLKLPAAGFRHGSTGNNTSVGITGRYWSSTVSGIYASHLELNSTGAGSWANRRSYSSSVRCIKN